MEMAFPREIKLPIRDSTNDRIWRHLQHSTEPLKDLDSGKFCVPKIIEEIETGCSPCPDILTEDFGTKPSVLFVSTVYGLIFKYLKKEFLRPENSWRELVKVFYEEIINPKKGIYGRLETIFDQVSFSWNYNPEFCFTELVKTVLVDKENKVSGLESQGSFVKYLLKHEVDFLQERLSKIEAKSIIFTFSEISTFFAMTSLVGVKDPLGVSAVPDNFVEMYREDPIKIKFESKKNRKKAPISIFSSGGSYSQSITFNVLFRLKDRDIYVIPLPHPSPANNRHWPHDIWPKLEELIKKTKD